MKRSGFWTWDKGVPSCCGIVLLRDSPATETLLARRSNREYSSLTHERSRRVPLIWLQEPVALQKIVSGGQTGVDRGALEAALAAHFPCGGFCPSEREAEDGAIPARYPLTALVRGGYAERTRANVLMSDGTVILFDGRRTGGQLTGGTRLTRICCQDAPKPLLIVDRAKTSEVAAAPVILEFVKANGIRVLNVAGPRGSGWPEGFDFALELISRVLKNEI
jgi:hypothetical protein